MPIKKRITGKPKPKVLAEVSLRPGMRPEQPLAYMVSKPGRPPHYGPKEVCERTKEEWDNA